MPRDTELRAPVPCGWRRPPALAGVGGGFATLALGIVAVIAADEDVLAVFIVANVLLAAAVYATIHAGGALVKPSAAAGRHW